MNTQQRRQALLAYAPHEMEQSKMYVKIDMYAKTREALRQLAEYEGKTMIVCMDDLVQQAMRRKGGQG